MGKRPLLTSARQDIGYARLSQAISGLSQATSGYPPQELGRTISCLKDCTDGYKIDGIKIKER